MILDMTDNVRFILITKYTNLQNQLLTGIDNESEHTMETFFYSLKELK
jgi:hypothetical protein